MTRNKLTQQQEEVHNRLQNDLEYFCKIALKIKLKEGGHAPFVWNKAQKYLHYRIEDQLARTGMVRLFILKGRQQGISTYIAARLYHKTTRRRGQRTFILSHQASTTQTLFDIVDGYHDSCPPEITPRCTVNNNRQMKFENQSQYTVGTAGSSSVGRGDTIQNFHGSEVAFYDDTDSITTGVMQAVADVPGTEKYNESTANGIGNYFHLGCMDALAKEGDYEIVFIPWYWQDEYRKEPKSKPDRPFTLTEYEIKLKRMYGLDDWQIQWRRDKIIELKSERKFKQESPFTIQEAFQASGDSLIDPEKVAEARKSTLTDKGKPLILGVDAARKGDRTCITLRQGRHWIKTWVYRDMNEMRLVGIVARLINELGIAKVFIDVAHGYGTMDRLHELDYEDIVLGVHFGSKADNETRYTNKRAEMAGSLRDWFETEGGTRIPDDEEIGVDLGAVPDFKETSSNLLQLESKDNIKKKFGKSPDIFDSAMLTFAYPVRSDLQNQIQQQQRNRTTTTRKGSALAAVRASKQQKAKEYNDLDDPVWETRAKKSGWRRK